MSEGYVYAGYGITLATLGLYALRVLRRGHNLRRALGDDGPPPARDGA